MKQLPHAFPWQWLLYASVLFFALSHFLNVMPMVFAEAGDPANMSQETLLQQQQELEKELDRLNTRLQEVRDQLGRLAQTPAPQQPDDQQQAQSQLQEEEAIMLEEMSIVSTRILKRPSGISFSSTPQSETDSQPTRTMKESLESLPGVILRQANGPRDFSISIRGSGVKTSFAVRDIKVYEDGFSQSNRTGCHVLTSMIRGS